MVAPPVPWTALVLFTLPATVSNTPRTHWQTDEAVATNAWVYKYLLTHTHVVGFTIMKVAYLIALTGHVLWWTVESTLDPLYAWNSVYMSEDYQLWYVCNTNQPSSGNVDSAWSTCCQVVFIHTFLLRSVYHCVAHCLPVTHCLFVCFCFCLLV